MSNRNDHFGIRCATCGEKIDTNDMLRIMNMNMNGIQLGLSQRVVCCMGHPTTITIKAVVFRCEKG